MHFKKICSILLVFSLLLAMAACNPGSTPPPASESSAPAASTPAEPATPATPPAPPPGHPTSIPDTLNIDWGARYHFAELEDQLRAMNTQYADITSLYSIGSSWQERELWCLEISNPAIAAEKKTGIGIFANIHGDEREGASSAMYTAWWFVVNSGDAYVKHILDNYILYVIPVINPDGYEQSFVYGSRPNLRPQDKNGNSIPYSDPYTDIDGDGYIATLYRGTADTQPNRSEAPVFGMESPDWDKNNVLGDDPRTSGIDMNRTFDYQWNRYEVEKANLANAHDLWAGGNSWPTSGPTAASEPEVKALQNFMAQKPMSALTTLHTGIQCVLYPWCYRPYDANDPKDAEIPFMKDVAEKMAAKFAETTGRGYYTMSSHEDYPTTAELIDYSFGRHNIHSYTIEVYLGGKSGNKDDCMWENTLPEPKWVFYSQAELLEKLKLDPAALLGTDGDPLGANEGLWFYTSSKAQMVDKAPEDQLTMVQGAKDSILVMIESEPYGAGYQTPFYVR